MGKKKNIKSEQILSEEYEDNLTITKHLGELGYWFEGHKFEDDWFGVDKRGHIFYAYSNGPATIPKVVTDNWQLQLELKDYFLNMLDFSTSEIIKVDKTYLLYDIIDNEIEITLARKGIFCFHILDGYNLLKEDSEYEEFQKYPYFLRKIIAPAQPINITSLNYQIQELMSSFVFGVDVNCNFIYLDRKSKTYKHSLFKKIGSE